MTIDISGPRGFKTFLVAGLTPGSPRCSTSTAGTTCALSIGELTPCKRSNCYRATLKTYDAVSCTTTCSIPSGAHELSAEQHIPFNVNAGTTNNLTFTLAGIPQNISVAPLNPGYLQGDANKLSLWGPQSQSLLVVAYDADNNPIVGPGSPAITVTSSASSLVATNPSPTSPNVVTLHAPLTGTPPVVTPGTVNLSIVATPSGGSGSPVKLTVPLTISHSGVYIGGTLGIAVYLDGNTATPNAMITGSNTSLSGDVYVVGADARGVIYAVSQNTNAIYEFAPGANGNVAPANTITGASTNLSSPSGIAIDSFGTVYVSNFASNNITAFAAGSSGNVQPSVTLYGSFALLYEPGGLAFDASGNLYVANPSSKVFSILPANAGLFATASSINGPNTQNFSAGQVALLPDGTLCADEQYYPPSASSAVIEYAPGATGNVAPVRAITGPATQLDAVSGIAADPNGNIYVVDNNTVTEYAPGASGNVAPIATLKPGFTGAGTTDGIAVFPNVGSP